MINGQSVDNHGQLAGNQQYRPIQCHQNLSHVQISLKEIKTSCQISEKLSTPTHAKTPKRNHRNTLSIFCVLQSWTQKTKK